MLLLNITLQPTAGYPLFLSICAGRCGEARIETPVGRSRDCGVGVAAPGLKGSHAVAETCLSPETRASNARGGHSNKTRARLTRVRPRRCGALRCGL